VALVIPTYLSRSNTPSVSSLLYQEKLTFFMPTGFTPKEFQSVAEFPQYCRNNSVSLPGWIWSFCEQYFQNSDEALVCATTLEPLRGLVNIVATSYNRNRAAIDSSRNLLFEHPHLLNTIRNMRLRTPFVAREVLSHVLYEVFLEEGHSGCVEYLREHTATPEATDWLIGAVLVNRFKLFVAMNEPVVLFEHAWHELFGQLQVALDSSRQVELDDAQRAELFSHSLFEAIVTPIFGWIDSRDKAEMVAKVSRKSRDSISSLKTLCRDVGVEMIITPTQDKRLRERLLARRLEDLIVEPLAELLRRPKRDVLQLVKDFLLDSTVVGGVLSIADGFNASTVGLAGAAGAISIGAKYLFSETESRSTAPAAVLVEGLRHSGVQEADLFKELRSLASRLSTAPQT
jgi:hypothetical protein